MIAAPIMRLGQAEYETAIHGALRRGFGHHRNPVGRIAEVANSNLSTARNWWERKCAPGGLHLLRLIAGEPTFQGEVRRLTGMATDLDPEFERGLVELYRLYQERISKDG